MVKVVRPRPLRVSPTEGSAEPTEGSAKPESPFVIPSAARDLHRLRSAPRQQISRYARNDKASSAAPGALPVAPSAAGAKPDAPFVIPSAARDLPRLRDAPGLQISRYARNDKASSAAPGALPVAPSAAGAKPDAPFVIPSAAGAKPESPFVIPSAARDLHRLRDAPGLQISRYARNDTNRLPRPLPGHRQRGVGFLALLFTLAILGIALAGTGALWQTEGRREKEKELLFAGEEYRRAITRYYAATPGDAKEFPRTLEELLDDRRFPVPVRHLRRLYREPMSADGQWESIRQQQRIVGVASRSTDTPIKAAGFGAGQEDFAGAQSYAQWRFTSDGGGAAAGGAAPGVAQAGTTAAPTGAGTTDGAPAR